MTKEIEVSQKLYTDVRSIIEQGRKTAYAAVNKSIILTNWHIGQRIVMEEQQGKERAQYGSRLIKGLAQKLVPVFGNAYSKRNLDYYRRFYLSFRNIEIVNACVHNH